MVNGKQLKGLMYVVLEQTVTNRRNNKDVEMTKAERRVSKDLIIAKS
jgi:hypothetical protein